MSRVSTSKPLRHDRYFHLRPMLFALLVGFGLGYSLKVCTTPSDSNLELNLLEDFSASVKKQNMAYSPSVRHLLTLEDSDLSSLAAHEYSCNVLKAFEELTYLHKKAEDLQEHNRRGEANLARKATIARKANAAAAASGSFKNCVAIMSPELLKFWEEKFNNGKLSYHAWSDRKEKGIPGGITFEELEETADSLDFN